jgi:hypothetical protein
MPIINDPRVKLSHILKSDQDRPENEQTIFYFRVITASEFKKFAEIYDRIAGSETGPGVVDDAIKKVDDAVTGWENFKINGKEISYASGKIAGLLIMEEIIELLTAILSKQSLSIEDKKKLDLQSQ